MNWKSTTRNNYHNWMIVFVKNCYKREKNYVILNQNVSSLLKTLPMKLSWFFGWKECSKVISLIFSKLTKKVEKQIKSKRKSRKSVNLWVEFDNLSFLG